MCKRRKTWKNIYNGFLENGFWISRKPLWTKILTYSIWTPFFFHLLLFVFYVPCPFIAPHNFLCFVGLVLLARYVRCRLLQFLLSSNVSCVYHLVHVFSPIIYILEMMLRIIVFFSFHFLWKFLVAHIFAPWHSQYTSIDLYFCWFSSFEKWLPSIEYDKERLLLHNNSVLFS